MCAVPEVRDKWFVGSEFVTCELCLLPHTQIWHMWDRTVSKGIAVLQYIVMNVTDVLHILFVVSRIQSSRKFNTFILKYLL